MVGILPRVQHVSRRVGQGVRVEVDDPIGSVRLVSPKSGLCPQRRGTGKPTAGDRIGPGVSAVAPPRPVVVRRPRSDASPSATWRSVGPW
jgi:hypothetical protein